MKFLTKMKDGGPNSPVDGYFLFEIKWLCSIVFLRFNKGRREAFHTHAFNAFTWFIKGDMEEEDVKGSLYKYSRGILPKITRRSKYHRVKATEDSWCISLRGPWYNTWTEFNPLTVKTTILTHGRVVVKEQYD